MLDLNVYHYYAHVPLVAIDVPPKIEFLPLIGARQHRIIFDIDDCSTNDTEQQVQRPSLPSQQRNSFLQVSARLISIGLKQSASLHS
jgi:hypothetical protein